MDYEIEKMSEKSREEIIIRQARIFDWEEAITLAWRTFLKFEANDYGTSGIRSFRKFLADTTLRRMFLLGKYTMFIAVAGGRIVGMISLRSENHISLLFVEEKYHRKGIGGALIRHAEEYLHEELQMRTITVDAAPYAVEFYHKLNYKDTQPERCMDGIRFTSMVKEI